jgi:hypothetical protein
LEESSGSQIVSNQRQDDGSAQNYKGWLVSFAQIEIRLISSNIFGA